MRLIVEEKLGEFVPLSTVMYKLHTNVDFLLKESIACKVPRRYGVHWYNNYSQWKARPFLVQFLLLAFSPL